MLDGRGRPAARHRDWAERFARWGFVALTLDSFALRGIKALRELKDRPSRPWNARTADVCVARCIELADRLRALPQPVRAVTYPGAHHGFDAPARAAQLLSKIYNPAVAGEHGAYIGTHPLAR